MLSSESSIPANYRQILSDLLPIYQAYCRGEESEDKDVQARLGAICLYKDMQKMLDVDENDYAIYQAIEKHFTTYCTSNGGGISCDEIKSFLGQVIEKLPEVVSDVDFTPSMLEDPSSLARGSDEAGPSDPAVPSVVVSGELTREDIALINRWSWLYSGAGGTQEICDILFDKVYPALADGGTTITAYESLSSWYSGRAEFPAGTLQAFSDFVCKLQKFQRYIRENFENGGSKADRFGEDWNKALLNVINTVRNLTPESYQRALLPEDVRLVAREAGRSEAPAPAPVFGAAPVFFRPYGASGAAPAQVPVPVPVPVPASASASAPVSAMFATSPADKRSAGYAIKRRIKELEGQIPGKSLSEQKLKQAKISVLRRVLDVVEHPENYLETLKSFATENLGKKLDASIFYEKLFNSPRYTGDLCGYRLEALIQGKTKTILTKKGEAVTDVLETLRHSEEVRPKLLRGASSSR
jgi:hypothetical protein